MILKSSIVSAIVAVASANQVPIQETSPICKCTPKDSCWPSDSDFDILNKTVSGNLIKSVPPASVCYKNSTWDNYDEQACNYVQANWLNSTFHASDPSSVGWPQWADNPCPPDGAGKQECTLGGYPVYVLNATNERDIASVIKWAGSRNIRINIKSTGHSFTGRSTSYGSISIWTHNFRGIEYFDGFEPTSCPEAGKHMAFAIKAGERVRDVYEGADRHDAIVVGGSAQDVGIVGWFTGGGHGPLSQEYGHGADNVLQVNIVAPAGDILTANDCQNSDLFWAIRGGGGGTFGVVTEVVMKAYKATPTEKIEFSLEPAESENLERYWDAVAYFWSDLPRLKAGGLSGYMFVNGGPLPLAGLEDDSETSAYAFTGALSVFNKTNGTADALFEPLKEHLSNTSLGVNLTTETSYAPSFFSSWNSSIGDEPVGGAGISLGSRLLSAKALTSDPQQLSNTIRNLTSTTSILQVFLVANSANRGLDVALNPAWRDAVVHTITGWGFLYGSSEEVQQEAYDMVTKVLAPQLKSLDPDSGAYFNEADAFDPSWQYDFWGPNYARLEEVKDKYDPGSVLWCRSCVGSEAWSEEEDGRLCRVGWSL